jgi:hypothetical protein
MYNNGYIDDGLKNSVDMTHNIYGISELQFSANYLYLPFADTSKSPLGFFASVSTGFIRALNFTPDVYKLIMLGNKSLAGQEATFNNSRFYMCDFQKLSLGFSLRLPSERGDAFAVIYAGPVKGQRYMEFESAESSLYTSETGEVLDLQANATWYSSDQSKRSNSDFAGNGFAAGAMLHINDQVSGYWIFARADNIGSINWKHSSTRTYIDTTYHFSGIEITNILNLDSTGINISSDTLRKIIEQNTDTIHFRRSLPETFYIESGSHFLNNKITISGSLLYVFRTGMPLPRLNLQTRWNFNRYFSPFINLAHGGSGTFSGGIGVVSRPTKNLYFQIFTPDILSFFAPDFSYANGLTFRAAWTF